MRNVVPLCSRECIHTSYPLLPKGLEGLPYNDEFGVAIMTLGSCLSRYVFPIV